MPDSPPGSTGALDNVIVQYVASEAAPRPFAKLPRHTAVVPSSWVICSKLHRLCGSCNETLQTSWKKTVSIGYTCQVLFTSLPLLPLYAVDCHVVIFRTTMVQALVAANRHETESITTADVI